MSLGHIIFAAVTLIVVAIVVIVAGNPVSPRSRARAHARRKESWVRQNHPLSNVGDSDAAYASYLIASSDSGSSSSGDSYSGSSDCGSSSDGGGGGCD